MPRLKKRKRKRMIILTDKKQRKIARVKLSNGFEVPKEIDINILEEDNAEGHTLQGTSGKRDKKRG